MSDKPNEPTFKERLAAIRERCDAATEGPLNNMPRCRAVYSGGMCIAEFSENADAEFFAASRTDVPRLLELVKAAIEMIPEDCYHRENMAYLTRILAGKGGE